MFGAALALLRFSAGLSRLLLLSPKSARAAPSTACIDDMKIHWDGYGEEEDRVWEKVDLCEINKITLRYNKKTNVTSMTAE